MISHSRVATVGKPSLRPSAVEVVEVNGSQSTAKEGIWEWDRVLKVNCVVELPADHLSLCSSPAVVADGTPLVVETDLHAAFVWLDSIHQTNVSLVAVVSRYWRVRKWESVCTESITALDTKIYDFYILIVLCKCRWQLISAQSLLRILWLIYWYRLLSQNTAASDMWKLQKMSGKPLASQSKMCSSFPWQFGSLNKTGSPPNWKSLKTADMASSREQI